MVKDMNKSEEIEALEQKIKQKNRRINILIIVNIILILLLFLLYILGYRIGLIGYKQTSSDTIDIIAVTEGDLSWNKMETLNIFNNSKFDGEKIIAPNSSEVYNFAIKNTIDEDIEYKISFEEETKYPINMKYRLKIDNIYIVGNEDRWVDAEELIQEAVKVTKGSINIFTLEWKWIDDDKNDTYVGILDKADYTLRINIQARTLNDDLIEKQEV